jgi:hypothetical protein
MTNKFSITKLEIARRNPKAFAKLLKTDAASDSAFGGYPKSMRWLNAICKYHASKNISDAITSIENAFSNRQDSAKNRQELESFINSLGTYENEIDKRGLNLIKSRESINIVLSPLMKITGQISAIFMNNDSGFSSFFVSKPSQNWENELKYPIIQHFVAKDIFNVEDNEVHVGYIDFLSGHIFSTKYSDKDIKSSLEELNSIGSSISSILK